MELHDWVRNAIGHAGMTIEQLGAALGRSKGAAGFWATGDTKPSFAQIQKIAEVTGYPMPDQSLGASDIQKARAKRWPFPRVDQKKLFAVDGPSARNLENAMLAVAGDLGIDIRTERTGKPRRA